MQNSTRFILRLFALLAPALPALAVLSPLPEPSLAGLMFTPTTPASASAIKVVAVDEQRRLLVAGGFEAIDGTPRPGLAVVDAANALVGTWQPDTPSGWDVTTAIADGTGGWLAAGRWFAGGGTAELRRFDGTTGTSTVLFTGVGNTEITSIALGPAGAIYIGLSLPLSGVGQLVSAPAVVYRIHAAGGRDTSFEFSASGSLECVFGFTRPLIWSLFHDGISTLYIGGSFIAIDVGGQPFGRTGLARASTNGVPLPGSTKRAAATEGATTKLTTFYCPGGRVLSVAMGVNGDFYAAGDFGAERRSLTTGALLQTLGPHHPEPPGPSATYVPYLAAVAADRLRHRVYTAGTFTAAGGVPRSNLAAFSSLAGMPVQDDWEPPADNAPASKLYVVDDRVIVARNYGNFTESLANLANIVTAYEASEPSILGHYYQSILGRSPDAGGVGFWPGEVSRLATLTGDATLGYVAMAMYFFGSPEFTSTPLTNAQFVDRLYLTFLDRASDPSGSAYWGGLLDQGMTREMVMFAFMFSPEFSTYMAGILGPSTARPEVGVVVDFYRGALGRMPDADGLRFWVNRFRDAQCALPGLAASQVYAAALEISNSFFESAEYLGSGATDAAYVSDLYNAFMRRSADLDGFNSWVTGLGSGSLSRAQARRAFIDTPEFGARVQAIVDAGCTALMN